MESFNNEGLAQYDGNNGTSSYIAYNGRVYDVSSSVLWRNGNHQVLHNAGSDLTNSLEQAPHGADMLERFPVVGMFRSD